MPGCGSTRSVMTAACHDLRRARMLDVPHPPQTYRDLAERAWAWVQTNVRESDEGLWLPEQADQTEPGEYPFGMHSGIGGLAHVLAEIRLTRPLTNGEEELAAGIAATLVRRIPDQTEFDYFDGLVSTVGVLAALDAAGSDLAVARLGELAAPDGWQPSWLEEYDFAADGRCNDATIGNASVLLGALWAMRDDVPGAEDLAARSADIVLAEREETASGLDWTFVPRRFWHGPRGQVHQWSPG